MSSSRHLRPMGGRQPAARVVAMGVIALLIAACGEAAPSPSPAAAVPATSPPSPTPAVSATPTTSATPTGDTSSAEGPEAYDVDPDVVDMSSMPINLEMRRGCGLCGEDGWLAEQPEFRLYADGTVLFGEGSGEERRYRRASLADEQVEELIRYALDEGGLAEAGKRYEGDMDDAGETVFDIHALYIDDAADKRVVVFPADGDVGDTTIRKRLGALERTLDDFGRWLTDRGVRSEPFEPDGYTAALLEESEGPVSTDWPLPGVTPDDFAPGAWGRFARLTPDQANVVIGDGMAAMVPGVRSGPGKVASLAIRPLLPGEDRPGAFGLRPDVVAVTVTDGVRMRSLPEVSDASVKFEPLLRKGDVLYVVDGPVEGSGYRWIEVYATWAERSGWVAIQSKEHESWVEPRPIGCTLGASDDPMMDQLPYDLMHLACYGDVAMGGTYRLSRAPDDESCSDDVHDLEPAWLNRSATCDMRLSADEADTGSYDLPGAGVFAPDAAATARELLAAAPDPARGIIVSVNGRLDHPDARECRDLQGSPSTAVWVRLTCRTTFVITEVKGAG